MSHYTVHSVEGGKAELTFHGVPYADFDRAGHWSVWAISKMFEASRLVSLYNGFLTFRSVDDSAHAMVVRKQSFRLNPRLHQDISLFSKLEMKFNLSVVSVGRTSVSYVTRMSDGVTGEQLAENHLRFVRIHRKTRRPIEFPPFFAEKFSHLKGRETTPFMERRGVTKTPDDAYVYKVLTRSSDCDRNNHVNQAAYVRFCMDCATDAALNKYYRHFDSDMCMYTTTYWEIDYIGEGGSRDELFVLTWQSEEEAGSINFSIKRGSSEIFHASTLFELERQVSPAKKNARL